MENWSAHGPILFHVRWNQVGTKLFPYWPRMSKSQTLSLLKSAVEHFNYSSSSHHLEPVSDPLDVSAIFEPDLLSKMFSAVYLITSLDFCLLEVYTVSMVAAMSLHLFFLQMIRKFPIPSLAWWWIWDSCYSLLCHIVMALEHMVNTDDLHATVYWVNLRPVSFTYMWVLIKKWNWHRDLCFLLTLMLWWYSDIMLRSFMLTGIINECRESNCVSTQALSYNS